MAKITLAEAIQQEIANSKGSVTAVADGKFDGPVRNMDAGDPLMKGDEFTIPADFREHMLQVTISEGSKPAKFIMVEVSNPETGQEKNVRFFPNQLAKIIFPVDEKGKRLPKVKTTGTASKLYASFNIIDEAMDALVGKKIKVTNDEMYKTTRYQSDEIVNSHIYQYDLA